MRPVTITMQGFGPFADPISVDFENSELFALVGPTGSGKSTIIDAICFALYGSIPRYDDRRAVGAVVHAVAMEARVSLTFEIANRRYVAARVVRRDKHGKSSTKEVRLEELDGDVLAATGREMDAAVPLLLGLGFDQFTRAVVLPQGEFARFLHDKPAARQDLLVQLLGLDVYERMMQAARARAAAAESGLAKDRERIDALAGATREAIAALVAGADAYARARKEWRDRQPGLEAQTREVDEADRAAAAADGVVQVLIAIAPPQGLATHSATLRTAEQNLIAAEHRVEQVANAVVAADAAIAAAGPRESLLIVRDAHLETAKLVEQRALLDAEMAAAGIELDQAVLARAAADEHTEQLRTASAAHVVREHLAEGEPCPVCEQIVTRVPSGRAPAAWRDARDAAARARTHADDASKRVLRIEHQVESMVTRQAELVEQLTNAPTLDAVTLELARLDTLTEAAVVARREEQEARGAIRGAKEAFAEATLATQQARSSFRTQRDGAGAVGLAPPSETDDVEHDFGALVAWAETEAERHRNLAAAATDRAAATRRALDEQLQVLVAEAAALELPLDSRAPSVSDLLEAAAGEERVTRERIDQLGADQREREQLVARVAAQAGDVGVASELARLLDANHFERWLVSEALTRLIAGGSARLHDLSAGRYSFAFDEAGRDFLVVDHTQGDERRSVRTLSGGETFQASLALALALADELAGFAADGTTRLESVFLDEGFGTLDAETLEAVAATIENLGADDRMVGIVTHVPELAARMPVQFRVHKGARTSTVERIDG